MRFVNHGIHFLENAYARNLFVNGNHRISFFAKTEIKFGDEILFDYGKEFIAPWKKDFDNKIKKLNSNLTNNKKVNDYEIMEISDF